MKIAIVNEEFSIGGVQRVASVVGAGLEEKGYNVTFLNLNSEKGFYYFDIENDKRETLRFETLDTNIFKMNEFFNKIPFKLKNNEYKVEKIYKKRINLLKKFISENSFDIVIMCQGLLTAFIPILKKSFPTIKFIAWQHSSYDVYVKRYYKAFLNDYIKGLKCADVIVCLTLSDCKLFKKYNDFTIAIYNPLTITPSRIADMKNKSIIFTGKIDIYKKGLDYLLDIFRNTNLNDWELLIAGDGEDTDKLKRIISKKGLVNRVKFLGPLKGDALCEHYLSGSIFLSTSRWEGFGLVITEAMVSGLPVISFNNFGPREILSEGEYGILIDKFDIESFTIELRKMMKSYQRRIEYQNKSLVRAKRFSKENIINDWDTLIKKLTK